MHRSTILLLLLLLPLTLSAQKLRAHRGTVADTYNFWFYTPPAVPLPETLSPYHATPVDSAALRMDTLAWVLPGVEPSMPAKPLVIFLHGASLCGRNLSRVRTYGTIDALEKGLRLDAYVMAPQNPGGAWSPTKLTRLLDWAIANHSIDTTRIYVLGMSLGGYGTIDFAAHSAHRIAAAMALCGGATESKNIPNLNQMPMAIIHGTGDRAVPWSASQAVVNLMRAAGDTSRLYYRLLPGQSHGALARYFYAKPVYEWLFEHSLADSLRPLNRNYDLGIHITNDVYRKLPKVETPLIVQDARKDRERDESNSTGGSVHVVRQGDTLSAIARQHRTTVARLCRINGLTRTSTLRIGQKIRY